MNNKEIKFEKNQLVDVLITDIGESGEGIGKADGYTLFVKDAVIGDKVTALITKAKKNYGYARVNKVVEPSPHRVEAPCKDASRCGGCQIQAMSYAAQLNYKEKKVRDNLVRIGGFSEEFIEDIMEPIVGADNGLEYRYRNKAQFPIGTDKEGNIIAGFYAGRTHSIIPCEDCLIGAKENAEILNIIIEYMSKNHVSAYDEKTGKGIVRHVLIRKGFTTNEIMVCLVIKSAGKVSKKNSFVCSSLSNQKELTDKLMSVEGVTSVSVSVNPDNTNVIMGTTIYTLAGEDKIKDIMHLRNVDDNFAVVSGSDVVFEISPLSFYQVNPYQVEKLYSIALSYADLKEGEELWDICCGIGTISLCAAKNHKNIKVHGIEIVPEAIEDAKKNAENNKIENAEFICAPAEDYLPKNINKIRADVVILDPPRKGMEIEALESVIKVSPNRIVYVSCDPSTLARDLKYLCENGYELEEVRPVDMFSHSVHVECVVLLSRVKAK